MGFSLIWRYGEQSSHERVPDGTLRELLAELDVNVDDVEHGDVWLSEDDSGWGIGVFAGGRGLVVLENSETADEPSHRVGVGRAEAFALLRRAADGEMEAIRGEDWQPGYGS
ncbi:hypothetical protein [Actinoplanes couchii]|uniref:Uncharacterized protein n=1 Tax=Actinoplanes couchii TaxID=403638 RepID=A0ABQ3XF77_9ACTN|nr:hypothetical protein [Actinoplanes couchii]MDR6321886.1 xanthine/CO dehydrogenase XdhC/CoxF family maturation factor [Actinoplanes couchii]GID57156.1 hypothetical protein Aco03nite_055600 [Actinoplanes couchii]